MKIIKKICKIAAVLFAFYLIIYMWVTAGFLVAMIGVFSFLVCFVIIYSLNKDDKGSEGETMLLFRRDWNDPYS